MKRNISLLIVVAVLAFSISGVASSAQTMGTSFTYQGFLKDNGAPANAPYDFEFKLFDGAASATQVGSTVYQDDVSVADGLFVVKLDFGVAPFSGEARWLEIGVRPGADTGPYTALAPRQELTPAPYALTAPRQSFLAAPDGNPANAVVVDNAGKVGINYPAPNTTLTVGGLVEATSGFMFPDGSVQTTSADNLQRVVADFIVAADETINAGDVVSFLNGYAYKGPIAFGPESVFNPASSDRISAAALSATQVVIAYRDVDNSNYGTVVIGDISGDSISFGTEYVFKAAYVYYISVASLSANQFVVAFQDPFASYYGTAIVGDVTGNAITLGAEYVFNSTFTAHVSAVPLSLTQFAVAYASTGGYVGYAVIGTVTGNTIAFGTVTTFNTGGSVEISASALTRNKFIVAYSDSTTSSGTAQVGDVAGNVITFGSKFVFQSNHTTYISTAALSSSTFVVAYRDESNAYGTAIVGTVSGANIAYGATAVFHAGTTLYVDVVALSATRFVVTHWLGNIVIGDVSGLTITFSPEIQFNGGSGAHYDAMAPLSDSKLAIAYRDNGNSSFGTARVVDLSSRTVGIARQSRNAGQTLSVIVAGVSFQHSGLTPGQLYYQDETGALTTTPTAWPVGLATSANGILLDVDFFGP